jgi:hypothetical protein
MESITTYLDENIFDIDVITLLENDALSYETNENITIHRVKNDSFVRPLRFAKPVNILFHNLKALWNITLQNFLPEYVGWKKNAQNVIDSLYENKNYDIILSSYAPAAAHEIALKTKKTYGGKLIADMRDEMSLNPFSSSLKRKKMALLEQEIFSACDMIVAVSNPLLQDFQRLASKRSNSIKFVEIRNGYDFPLIKPYNHENQIFTISYVGSLYGYINAYNFLTALSILCEKNLLPPIKINFVGIGKPIHIPQILTSMVHILPIVPHIEAIDIMRNSDGLLLIHPTIGRKGVFTGKLFEYLGMMKPIIALVDPSDVAAHLIQQANAGFSVDNDDIEGIQKIVLRAYDEWEQKKDRIFNTDIIAKHHRKEQIKRLEKSILELCHE